MTEFSTKILVENTKKFIQLTNQIKRVRYNTFLFKEKENAKNKVEQQIKLYDAQLNQMELKLKI